MKFSQSYQRQIKGRTYFWNPDLYEFDEMEGFYAIPRFKQCTPFHGSTWMVMVEKIGWKCWRQVSIPFTCRDPRKNQEAL